MRLFSHISKKIKFISRIIAFLCFMSWSNHSFSTNYYVNDNSTTGDVFCSAVGNNGNNGTSAATPKLTVTNVLSTYSGSLTAGDTIKIDAGTYDLGNDHDITLTINGLSFVGAGISLTIFDHNYAGDNEYFMYIHANNIYFKDIQFTRYENQGTQTPGHSGQAITVEGSGITFYNVHFTNNGEANGGNPAISVLSSSTVTIDGGGSNCNRQGDTYAGGVEAYGQNITLTIKNYVIALNSKTGFNGGGLIIDGDNTTNVIVRNCLIDGNNSIKGGGIYMYDGNLSVFDCVIKNNNAGQTSTTVYGGGVCINAGVATFSRCKFLSNTTTSTVRGGAIGCRYVSLSLSGFSSRKTISLTVDSCVFSGNAGGTNGFDVYGANGFSNACNISMRDCQFLTGGNYNIVSDGSSPASSISVTYFGTQPTRSGTVSRTLSTNTLWTPNPSTPSYSGDCSSGIFLPVEYLLINGSCDNNHYIIKWATASETNNNFFTIEKSTDAENWNTLSIIQGAGNSNEPINYLYTDEDPGTQRNYYRLKQTDYDGQYSYSDIISVSPCYEGYFDMQVANNPVQDVMNVFVSSSYEQETNIHITDILGRNVFSAKKKLEKGDNTLQIDVSGLSNGIYILSAQPELGGQPAVKEIMINN